MIGSLLTRGLVLIFGYAYPAYECFETVEKNKPEVEQLRVWCQYWLPMYSEAKLAFYIYLWFPKTKGTTYVCDSFFKPYVAKHETDIDRNLMELRTRAGDMVVVYCQKAMSYSHTRFFEILQYVASHPTPISRPVQNQSQQVPRATHQPTKASSRQTPAKPKPKPKVESPPSPTPSTCSSQNQKDEEQGLSSSGNQRSMFEKLDKFFEMTDMEI